MVDETKGVEVKKSNPLDDLRKLTYLGRVEEDVKVLGFTARMHTLEGEKSTEALRAVSLDDDVSKVHQLRIEILARAIDTINGVPLEKLYEGNDTSLSTLARRVVVVGSWQQIVINKFFDTYNNLLDRSNKAVEELKN